MPRAKTGQWEKVPVTRVIQKPAQTIALTSPNRPFVESRIDMFSEEGGFL
jgi:hypothetical protein